MNHKIKTITISFRDDNDVDIELKDVESFFISGIKDNLSFTDMIFESKQCEEFSLALTRSADKKCADGLTLFERIVKFNNIEFISLYAEDDSLICYIDMPYDSSVNRGANSFQRSYIENNVLHVSIVNRFTEKRQEKLDNYYYEKQFGK